MSYTQAEDHPIVKKLIEKYPNVTRAFYRIESGTLEWFKGNHWAGCYWVRGDNELKYLKLDPESLTRP